MHEWLEAARDRLVATSDADAGALELSQEDIDEILELARVAAHESGERINAPLVSFLVGVVHGSRGTALPELVDAVVGKRV